MLSAVPPFSSPSGFSIWWPISSYKLYESQQLARRWAPLIKLATEGKEKRKQLLVGLCEQSGQQHLWCSRVCTSYRAVIPTGRSVGVSRGSHSRESLHSTGHPSRMKAFNFINLFSPTPLRKGAQRHSAASLLSWKWWVSSTPNTDERFRRVKFLLINRFSFSQILLRLGYHPQVYDIP